MKSAAEKALKLFTNSKGSYTLANREILSILSEKVKNHSASVESCISELQRAVAKSPVMQDAPKSQLQIGLSSL